MSKRGGFPGMGGGFRRNEYKQINARSKKNAGRYGEIPRRISG
jgi:hypothetical protein